MPIPMEYKKFLEEEVLERKLSFYEKFCKFFSFIKLPLPISLREKYQKEIEFCHLHITPSEAFSSSVFFPLLLIVFSFILYFIKIISFEFFGMISVTSLILFYFLFKHVEYLSFLFRTKASTEMVLSIIYMVTSLRIYGNLEKAIQFTAKNLTGPLGKDFRKALWDIYTGKKATALEVLDDLSEKWKVESREFSEALSLIKTSQLSAERRERNLDEATEVVLSGTVDRMNEYARKMKSPIALINMFGILLPLLGLMLVPVAMMLVPEVAKPELIAFLYDVVLFLVVYSMFRQHFYRRPYSLHRPKLTKTESTKLTKARILLISILVSFSIFPVTYLLFSSEILLFNEFQFFLSILLVVLIGLPFILYNFLLYLKLSKKNLDVIKIEDELPTATFQLSIELRTGKPIESAISSSISRLREMKIKDFFNKILINITELGMSFKDAIFDRKSGAILEYPSRTIEAVMSVLSEISEKGSFFLSKALEMISKYLKGIRSIDEETKKIFEEIIHSIEMQSLVVAPLTSGVVVGLTVFTLSIFFYLGGSLQNVNEYFGSLGTAGSMVGTGIFEIFNFSKMVPVPYFQLVVGIYLIEITYLMSYFCSELNYGDDDVSKAYAMAKAMFISLLLYSIIIVGLYYGVKSFINLEEFAGMMS